MDLLESSRDAYDMHIARLQIAMDDQGGCHRIKRILIWDF